MAQNKCKKVKVYNKHCMNVTYLSNDTYIVLKHNIHVKWQYVHVERCCK